MDELIMNVSKRRLEEGIEEKIQEETHELPESQKVVRTFKFPESKIAEMRDIYSRVVVRDFGDDYHMTLEEKVKKFDLYELFEPITKQKTTYRNIVDYIYAMRDCLKFIQAMAQKNRLIMDPDEFIADVFNGTIKIAQMRFPEYKGNDRKDLNWKEVRKYIVDPELNPEELSRKMEVKYLPTDTLENPEEHLKEYFTDEQIQLIFHGEEQAKVSSYYDPEYDEYASVVTPISKKDMKKFLKETPDLIRPLKDARARNLGNSAMKDFVYELESSAYHYIEQLDEKRGYIASDRMPHFSGNVSSKKDVKKYLYLLNEFEEEHRRVVYHGDYITLAQFKEEELKDELDNSGWNVMKIYSNKDAEKKRKRADKKDKKEEKKLRKQLSRIEKRRKKRNGGDSGDNKVNKKKSKVPKDQKKKFKKFDQAIANAKGANDYSEYEKQMLDMTYGYKG